MCAWRFSLLSIEYYVVYIRHEYLLPAGGWSKVIGSLFATIPRGPSCIANKWQLADGDMRNDVYAHR